MSSQDVNVLKRFVGDSKIVILDEAQRVENIGLSLKVLHNYCPDTQFIATGSSSFDLANKINEPLIGRNIKFEMYPLSIGEITVKCNKYSLNKQLEQIIRYGLYPGIFDLSEDDKRTKLRIIGQDYLYRDLLATDRIKMMGSLENLVRFLALSVGKKLSYIGITKKLQKKKINLSTK